MAYEILDNTIGLPLCIHNAEAGVGRNPEDEREKFAKIFRKKNIDYFKCPYAIYIAVGTKCDILFKDMDAFGEKFILMPNGEILEPSRQNFEIRCTRRECNNPEAWVKKYIPPPKP